MAPLGPKGPVDFKANRNYDLHDPKEMDQYLNDIEMEYSYDCYDQKDVEACYRLGDFAMSVRSNLKAAGPILKKNCDENNHGKSCWQYGVWLMNPNKYCTTHEEKIHPFKMPPPTDDEVKEALPYYDKACDRDCDRGCYYSAYVRAEKPELIKGYMDISPCKIEKLFNKSCTLKNKEACFEMHRSYLMGDKWVPKNLEKAFEYATKACDLDHPDGCKNLSLMYRYGHGCEQSEALYRKFDKKLRYLTGKMKMPKIEFNS